MRISSLRVPRKQVQVLVWLAQLTAESWTSIVEALGVAAMRESEVIERLHGIDDANSSGLLDVLTSLASSSQAYDWSASDIAETISEDATLELEPVERDTLRQRLAVGIKSKAVDCLLRTGIVLTSFERLFMTARILTDIRPIFPEIVEPAPHAVTISHTLRIDFTEAGELKSLYFAMDTPDLTILQKAIDRELQKTSTISSLLGEVDMQIFEPNRWGS
jgi:hypothetical protein